MTTLIKLTNNAEGFKGDPVYINLDHISSIYEFNNGSGFVTSLFSVLNNHQWVVEESPAEIQKILDGKDK